MRPGNPGCTGRIANLQKSIFPVTGDHLEHCFNQDRCVTSRDLKAGGMWRVCSCTCLPWCTAHMGIWAASLLLQDLHRRLDQARYAPPLEGAAFNYGFNSDYLQKVVAYWRNKFDWRKQVEILNKYPHFHTTIEGEWVTVPPCYTTVHFPSCLSCPCFALAGSIHGKRSFWMPSPDG